MCRVIKRWFICLQDRRSDNVVEPGPIADPDKPWESWQEGQIVYPESWDYRTDGDFPPAHEKLPENVVRARHLETLFYRCANGHSQTRCFDHQNKTCGEVCTELYECACSVCSLQGPGMPPKTKCLHIAVDHGRLPDAGVENDRQACIAAFTLGEIAGLLRGLIESLCDEIILDITVEEYVQQCLMYPVMCIEDEGHVMSGVYRCNCRTNKYICGQNLSRAARYVSTIEVRNRMDPEEWMLRMQSLIETDDDEDKSFFEMQKSRVAELTTYSDAAWMAFRDVKDPHLTTVVYDAFDELAGRLGLRRGLRRHTLETHLSINMAKGSAMNDARWWLFQEMLSYMVTDPGLSQDVARRAIVTLGLGLARDDWSETYAISPDGMNIMPAGYTLATLQDLAQTVQRIWPTQSHALRRATRRREGLHQLLRLNRDRIASNAEISTERIHDYLIPSRRPAKNAREVDARCSICFEEFRDGGLDDLDGGHQFDGPPRSHQYHHGWCITNLPCCEKPVHFSCAAQLVWKTPRCPYCRAEFTNDWWATMIPQDHVLGRMVRETFLTEADARHQ